MATLWTQDFTAADASTWDDVGFLRVAGGAFNATVYSNKGRAGATASARLYLSVGYPSLRDYKVDVTLVFKTPLVQGRCGGVAARLTDDGQTAYWADLCSYSPTGGGGTIGTPHVRLFRRRSGTDTQVVADTDISASVSAADLAAGVRLGLRVKNTAAGEVNLQVQVDRGAGFVTYATYVDSAGSGITIEDGGGVGLRLDGSSTSDDVTFDDFRVRDFEDEAATTAYQTGFAVIVNGTYYNSDELETLGLGGIRARQSYGIRTVGEVRDLNDIHLPALRPGDDFAILNGATFLAAGVVRPVMRGGGVPSEGITYEIHGPKVLCQGVVVTHPVSGQGQITFNQDPEDPTYDAGYANKTPGDLLEWLYDNHAEGQDGLRAHRAAPSYGTVAVIPAGLYTGPVIPKITLSGDFAQAVEFVLSYMPAWAWNVDAETRQHTFEDRSVATKTDVDLADDWIELDIEVHPELNKTAVLIRGGEPEVEMVTLDLNAGTLSADWLAGLVNGWDISKSRRSRATGIVASSAVATHLELTPDQTGGKFPMEVDEWVGAVLTFTSGAENGNSYEVYSNTLLKLLLWGGATPAWASGGPAALDTFVVEDKQSDPAAPPLTSSQWTGEALNNGNFGVFRQFVAAGAYAGAQFAQGKCFDIKVTTPLAGGADDQFEVRHVGGKINAQGKIVLDSPAVLPIGLVNYAVGRNGDVCSSGTAQGVGEGGAQYGNIEVTAPKKNTLTPKKRVPGVGFRGTAWTTDPAKWDGGGEAGIGDPGNRDIMVIDDPNFTSLGFASEYEKFADELLKCYGSLAVSARVTFTDRIDMTWAGLNKRLTLSDTETARVLGYEDSEDLWIAEVEWDFEAFTTTVNIGNLVAMGGLNIQAARQRYAETARMKQFRDAIRRQADMLNCLKDGFESAVAPEITGSQGVCVSQISTGTGVSLGAGHAEESDNDVTEYTPAPSACDPCAGLIISNKAQLALNAVDIASSYPALMQPTGRGAAPAGGGLWIEEIVSCAQSHISALWATMYDQTTAIEGTFQKVVECLIDKETDDAALKSAILAVYTCLNAFYRQVVATFAGVMPGPGVGLAADPGGGNFCAPPTITLHVCGDVCECAVLAKVVDCITPP